MKFCDIRHSFNPHLVHNNNLFGRFSEVHLYVLSDRGGKLNVTVTDHISAFFYTLSSQLDYHYLGKL